MDREEPAGGVSMGVGGWHGRYGRSYSRLVIERVKRYDGERQEDMGMG